MNVLECAISGGSVGEETVQSTISQYEKPNWINSWLNETLIFKASIPHIQMWPESHDTMRVNTSE